MDKFSDKPSSSAASLDGGNNNTPHLRQTLPSTWAQVVRGEAADSTADTALTATSSAPEQGVIVQSPELTGSGESGSQTLALAVVVERSEEGGNVRGESKEAVWNKPLKVVPDNTLVMEPTRPLRNSSSASSSKPVYDASSSTLVPDQGPVISNTQNNANANVNTNTYSNHSHGQFNRPKWNKRGITGRVGGGSVGFMQPPPPPTPPPLPPPFPGFPYPNLVVDAPIRGEGPDKPNNARPMGNQFSYWNRSQRGNFGGQRPRGRGDGPHANGFRGRHDQDWEWNGPRGYMPHLMVPPPPHVPWGFFTAPHPGAPPFFPNPIGFDLPFRGAPSLMPQAAPMFPPVMESPIDPPLTTKILNQIEYYFSEANLVSDSFLKNKMDGKAWVPISLIATFPRIVRLTNGISRGHSNDGHIKLILESLRNSTVVEVQGDKLRPRKDWERWVPNLAKGAGQGGPSDSSPLIFLGEFMKLRTNDGLSDASSSSEQHKSTSTSKLIGKGNGNWKNV